MPDISSTNGSSQVIRRLENTLKKEAATLLDALERVQQQLALLTKVNFKPGDRI